MSLDLPGTSDVQCQPNCEQPMVSPGGQRCALWNIVTAWGKDSCPSGVAALRCLPTPSKKARQQFRVDRDKDNGISWWLWVRVVLCGFNASDIVRRRRKCPARSICIRTAPNNCPRDDRAAGTFSTPEHWCMTPYPDGCESESSTIPRPRSRYSAQDATAPKARQRAADQWWHRTRDLSSVWDATRHRRTEGDGLSQTTLRASTSVTFTNQSTETCNVGPIA